MKNGLWRIVLSVLCLLANPACAQDPQLPAAPGAGVWLSSWTGTVRHNGRPLPEFEPGVKTPLSDSDLVEAEADSSAVIDYGGGLEVRLKEGTRARTSPDSLTLDRGDGWIHLKRKGREFRVITPSVVLAVRGTRFHVIVAENGAGTVEVLEGIVAVTGDWGELNVAAGKGASFDSSGARPLTPGKVIFSLPESAPDSAVSSGTPFVPEQPPGER